MFYSRRFFLDQSRKLYSFIQLLCSLAWKSLVICIWLIWNCFFVCLNNCNFLRFPCIDWKKKSCNWFFYINVHVNHSWLLEIIINISFEYLYRNCSVISPFLLTSEKGGKKVVLLYYYYSCIYFFYVFHHHHYK